MGLTSSLFAGLSGMKTNEFRMDVIGNNIANVNTYGFKSSRANFQTQFYNTLNFGSTPSGSLGGTNPIQVGTGTTVGSVNKDFSGGAPESTGKKTDLSIQGEGMFILKKADGAEIYTRDGAFQFNSENYLLSPDGFFLQGYGVDANFGIIEGALSNLRIPLGEITTAATTSFAKFSGNLNAGGPAALKPDGTYNGNIRTPLFSQTITDGAAGILTAGSLMINLQNPNGTFVETGNIITLPEAIKGGKTLPSDTLEITATTTLGEFMLWLEGVLGINTDAALSDLDGDGVADADPQPGVRINTLDDKSIEVVGNMGTLNALTLGNKALKIMQGTSASVIPGDALPFTFAEPGGFTAAEVETARTSFRGYDSLGIPINIDVTMVLQSKGASGGLTWRFYAESSEDSDTSRVVGTGTIVFDANGAFLEATNSIITVDRQNTGAATPQAIDLDFSEMDSFEMGSAVTLLSQDGFQSGTLQDFSIGPDGVISGSFTNGLTRNLGQVVLATFRNYEGLIAGADNIYISGPNSGNAIIKNPQQLGAGTVNSATLELSNVDLSREFINLIISSTGFSASSRVIQTSDRLLTELMMLIR